MLENDDFIKWANEHVIVVVGHSEEAHPTQREDERGKKVDGCPLYIGLTCEQHRKITHDVRYPEEGLPKLEYGNGMPNSWFVTPDGKVVPIDPSDQRIPGKIEDQAEELQREVGRYLTRDDYEDYLEEFAESDAAKKEGDLKEALKVLAKVERDLKKLPDGMKQQVEERLAALDAAAMERLEAIAQSEDDKRDRLKAATKLKYAMRKRLKRGYLPCVEKIEDWIKQEKNREDKDGA